MIFPEEPALRMVTLKCITLILSLLCFDRYGLYDRTNQKERELVNDQLYNTATIYMEWTQIHNVYTFYCWRLYQYTFNK